MKKDYFVSIVTIILLTLLAVWIGYIMGTNTKPRYHFENGGTVSCTSRC